MGNEFVINKRTMTITLLRSRTEAISKIPTPKTAKQCKSCVYIKDAYHSIKLTEKSKEYCAILPYFGRIVGMKFYQWVLHVHHKSGWIILLSLWQN